MLISAHQYRFLKVCGVAGSGKKTSRKAFESLYSVRNIKGANVVKYVTETLERLIDHGYMVGYGTRTPQKWYITDVKLTREGARAVKKYEARKQQRLPIKMKNSKFQAPASTKRKRGEPNHKQYQNSNVQNPKQKESKFGIFKFGI